MGNREKGAFTGCFCTERLSGRELVVGVYSRKGIFFFRVLIFVSCPLSLSILVQLSTASYSHIIFRFETVVESSKKEAR